MDKQQKLDYQQKIENYLTNEHVYDLMEDMLKALVVKQPDDPLSYLIDWLSHPQSKRIFLIGPPGFKVREFALQVADHYKLTTISVGDLLRKEKSKKLELGEYIESCFKHYSNVGDDIVISLVNKYIYLIQKDRKSFILSGFPRTRAQGLAMQREGIFPDAFIILNMSHAGILHHCYEKFKCYEKTLDKTVLANRELHIANHAQLYELNIKHIKQTYPNNYFEIDCDKRNREEILEDIARLLKFKIKSKRPKRPASILVLGGDKATRVAICRRIAKRYGFVLVLIRELLSEQIGKNSEVGRLILSNVRNKIDVKDSIINGLVQNRLSQVDVQMQGFILYGYPRTLGQALSLKEVYIQASLIVYLYGDNKLAPEISKIVGYKHQAVLMKLNSSLDYEKLFERVCFHLENN